MSESGSVIPLAPLTSLHLSLTSLESSLQPHLIRYSSLLSDLQSLKSSNPSAKPVNVLHLAALQAELALVLATLRFAEVRAEGCGVADERVKEARKVLERCRRAVKGVREVEAKVNPGPQQAL